MSEQTQLQSTLAFPKRRRGTEKKFNSLKSLPEPEPLDRTHVRLSAFTVRNDALAWRWPRPARDGHWQRIMQHEDGAATGRAPPQYSRGRLDIFLHLVLALLCTQRHKKCVCPSLLPSFSFQPGSTRPDGRCENKASPPVGKKNSTKRTQSNKAQVCVVVSSLRGFPWNAAGWGLWRHISVDRNVYRIFRTVRRG